MRHDSVHVITWPQWDGIWLLVRTVCIVQKPIVDLSTCPGFDRTGRHSRAVSEGHCLGIFEDQHMWISNSLIAVWPEGKKAGKAGTAGRLTWQAVRGFGSLPIKHPK